EEGQGPWEVRVAGGERIAGESVLGGLEREDSHHVDGEEAVDGEGEDERPLHGRGAGSSVGHAGASSSGSTSLKQTARIARRTGSGSRASANALPHWPPISARWIAWVQMIGYTTRPPVMADRKSVV